MIKKYIFAHFCFLKLKFLCLYQYKIIYLVKFLNAYYCETTFTSTDVHKGLNEQF